MYFHFDNKVCYLGQRRNPGDVAELSDADVLNLTKGGSGHGADACPGTCLAVRNGNAAIAEPELEAEEGLVDETDNPDGDPESAGGEGSDDPAAPGADPGPNSCAECNGRVFKTPQALASHVAQKH